MIRVAAFLVCGLLAVVPATTSEIVVATLNIHYTYDGQAKLPWDERRDSVVSAIEEIDADIFAFQEMETFAGSHSNPENVQQEWIGRAFPEYALTATGHPSVFPNTQPIMYRRDRFDVVDQGFFFFSPTPDEIYSRPWHGRYPYYATWAIFAEVRAVRGQTPEAGRRFAMINLHLDHASRRDRLLAADLVLERAREFAGLPLLIVGDFNALARFRTVRLFEEAGYEIAPVKGATYHFGRGLDLYPAIDHVLHSQHWRPGAASVYREAPGGVWPSDHYPVVVRFEAKR